ncbi:hypothetical protein LshimejAT787_1200230 [Lyophyllum shimeji]|uniref:DUF5648 domain-containing protein n=1 Tax=Lyophyllum shimeji TaxID=47721 RepID=A0A9P3PVZ3_LYOSH|nr:hypothetical protein LshimejAT787_1200230 [Lyophyllum shimeji]
MKCRVLVLFAFVGGACVVATTGVGRRDVDLVGRDRLDVVLETTRQDMELVDRTAPNIEARRPRLPEACPKRSEATSFHRYATYPFPVSTTIGYFFMGRLPRPHTRALYFAFKRSTGDFFYTTRRDEWVEAFERRGYVNRGVAGSAAGRDLHFYTASGRERNVARRYGWRDEGVMGYIFRE